MLCTGVRQIESFAAETFEELYPNRPTEMIAPLANDKDKQVELVLRSRVRDEFKILMAGEADEAVLEELSETFFTLTYPTPPKGWLSGQRH